MITRLLTVLPPDPINRLRLSKTLTTMIKRYYKPYKPTNAPAKWGVGAPRGQKPMTARQYIDKHAPVCLSIMAGMTFAQIGKKHSISNPTVLRIKHCMREEGWAIPKHQRPIKPKAPRIPAPRRICRTGQALLDHHAGITHWLRQGKTMKWISEKEEKSRTTIGIVKYTLDRMEGRRSARAKLATIPLNHEES